MVSIVCIRAKKIWRFIYSVGVSFLAELSIFWTLIKFIQYEVGLNQYPVFSKIEGFINKYNLVAIGLLLVLAVFLNRHKNRVKYSIVSNGVTITFRKKNVLKSKGYRVIEMSSNFCIDKDKLPKDSSIVAFYEKYSRVNGTNNFRSLLKKELAKYGFKPKKNINTDISKEDYSLGAICKFNFYRKDYLFVDSCPYDQSQNKTEMTDDQYSDFLATFWNNLAKFQIGDDMVSIPAFNSLNAVQINDNQRVYVILKSFISCIKAGVIPCKNLTICISGNEPIDSDLFIAFARVLDEYETSAIQNSNPDDDAVE